MKIPFIQNIIDIIRGKSPKPRVSFFVFWVGTKCSLKCKLCGNLIPFMNQVSYNADEIISDLRFLTDNISVKKLQIQGGESFTHPQIDKIISAIAKMKINKVEIATNGTIVPNKETIEVLKNNPNIIIRISEYECSSVLREKFCKLLDENNISYKFYDFRYHDGSWHSSGGISEERISQINMVKNVYQKCKSKGCITLADGFVYICGKIPAIKEIYGEYYHKDTDEINIRELRKLNLTLKNNKLRVLFKKFLNSKVVYKEQCRFCNISDEKFPAAVQLTKQEIDKSKIIIQNRQNARSCRGGGS